MIFITQCPVCQTRFNLNRDQLTKAGGKVRCGSCGLVFNAKKSLKETEGEEIKSIPWQTGTFITKDSSLNSLITKDNFSQETKPAGLVFNSPKLVESIQPKSFPSLFPAQKLDDLNSSRKQKLGPQPPRAQQQSARRLAKKSNINSGEKTIKQKRRTYLNEEGELTAELFGTREEINKTADNHYYNKEHFRKENKKTNFFIYNIYALLSTFGLLLIVAQLVLINRVYVSSSFPSMRSIIEIACKRIGCSVGLPSNISQVRTEFSEMIKIPEYNNLWQINAVLKNHAYYAQNYPFLVLELKDESGNLLLRRTLKPEQYLSKNDWKLKQLNANSEAKISLHLDANDLPVKNYKLIWFYPSAT